MKNLVKFVRTDTGRIVLSILLGLGIAALFRKMCNDNDCKRFVAPAIDEVTDKIFKYDKSCVKYDLVPVSCDKKKRIIE